MKWTLYIGKIAGIKLYIHWTFLILIGWIFIAHIQMENSFFDAIKEVAFVLSIFTCVILHEYGHVLAAKRYNIMTKNITILLIGGVANIEKMPEKPIQELLIALAGPLVNFFIALSLFLFFVLTNQLPTVDALVAIQENQQSLLSSNHFLFNLLIVNVILCLFNLIPAFPMDGGRVLRALLAFKFDRKKATNIAAILGQIIAVIFVFIGYYSNFFLIFIGIFIFLSAGNEASFEAMNSILSKYKIKDVLMTKYTSISPQDTLAKVVEVLLDGTEQNFLVISQGLFVGVLTRNKLIKGLSEYGNECTVSKVMSSDFLTFSIDMELKDVYQKMIETGCFIGPVYDLKILKGIVEKENIGEIILVDRALENKSDRTQNIL